MSALGYEVTQSSELPKLPYASVTPLQQVAANASGQWRTILTFKSSFIL